METANKIVIKNLTIEERQNIYQNKYLKTKNNIFIAHTHTNTASKNPISSAFSKSR